MGSKLVVVVVVVGNCELVVVVIGICEFVVVCCCDVVCVIPDEVTSKLAVVSTMSVFVLN